MVSRCSVGLYWIKTSVAYLKGHGVLSVVIITTNLSQAIQFSQYKHEYFEYFVGKLKVTIAPKVEFSIIQLRLRHSRIFRKILTLEKFANK